MKKIMELFFYLRNKPMLDSLAKRGKMDHLSWEQKVNYYWACVEFSGRSKV